MLQEQKTLTELIFELHSAQEKKDKYEQVKSLIALADYYYKSNDFQKSKMMLKEALKIDPKIPHANYLLALIELQEEKTNKAKESLKEELKINPQNEAASELLDKLEIHTNLPIVTISMALLAILSYIITFPSITFTELLRYSLNEFNFSLFTIFTSLFFHANLLHLILNLSILIIFGLYLEKYIGSIKFLIIFFASGIIGNILQYLIIPNSFVLGISSAIFGILGATLMREPLLQIKVFGIIKMPIILIFGAIFSIQSFVSNYLSNSDLFVGEIAHIFGFMIGLLIIGIIYRETIKTFYNWLAIAAGFWTILYAIEILKTMTNTFTIEQVITTTTLILLGTFLIFYSYFKLKLINTKNVIQNQND